MLRAKNISCNTLRAQLTKTSSMIKVSFADNLLLKEMQELGRLLSFLYLYYVETKRLGSTNFRHYKEIALVTRRNHGNALYQKVEQCNRPTSN